MNVGNVNIEKWQTASRKVVPYGSSCVRVGRRVNAIELISIHGHLMDPLDYFTVVVGLKGGHINLPTTSLPGQIPVHCLKVTET